MIVQELFSNFGNNPGKTDAVNVNLNAVCEFIKQHCSDFVSISNSENTFLHRGVSQFSKGNKLTLAPMFIGQSSVNRKSTGLDDWQHDILVKCFKMVGFTASRDRTISCSSSRNAAGSFGTLYYIFPVNGFSYSWSTKHADIGAINAMPDSKQELAANEFFNKIYNRNFNINAPVDEEGISQLALSLTQAKKIINYFGFTNKNLGQALDKRHEIAINGKYVAIATYLTTPSKLRELLK